MAPVRGHEDPDRGQGSAKSEPVCSEGAARPALLLSSASRVRSWRTAKGEFRRPNLAVAAGARKGAHAVRALTGKSSQQKGATESQRYRDREENDDFLHWPIAPTVDTDPTAVGRRILRIVPVKFGRGPSVRSGRDTVTNPTIKGCVVSPSTDQGVLLPRPFGWHEIRGQYGESSHWRIPSSSLSDRHLRVAPDQCLARHLLSQ
jgi:hypothetical protein